MPGKLPKALLKAKPPASLRNAVKLYGDDAARMAANQAGLGGKQALDTSSLLTPPHLSGRRLSWRQRQVAKRTLAELDDTWGNQLDKTVENFDGRVGKYGMLAFAGQMGLPMVGGGVAWAGSKLGSQTMEAVGGKLKAVPEITFSDIGTKTGMGGLASAVTEPVFGGLSLGAKALEATGIPQWNARRYAAKVEKNLANMHTHANSLFAHDIQHSGVKDAMGELATAIKSGVHPEHGYGHIAEAVKGVEAAAEEAAFHSKPFSKSLSKVAKFADKADIAHIESHGWGNLSALTKDAPKRMAKSGIMHGAMNATFIGGAMASDFHTGYGLHKNLRHLRAMYANITGEDVNDVSAIRLMMGKVPEPVAIARAEIYKEYGPAVILDGINTVMNVKMAAHSKLNNLWMFLTIPMANSMLVKPLLGGQLLDTYAELKKGEAAGAKLEPEAYTKLLGEVSKELRQRGGEDSNFAKALGYIYADEGKSIDAVLKEVDNGRLNVRIARLQHEYEAFKANSHTQPIHAMENSHAEEQPAADHNDISHVDRLNGTQANKDMAVVGKHTEMLKRNAHVQPHQPGVA